MFVEAYNIRDEGLGSGHFFFVGMTVYCVLLLLVANSKWHIRRSGKRVSIFGNCLFILIAVICVCLAVTTISEWFESRRWARTGDHETVEGNVKYYSTRVGRGDKVQHESFYVGDVFFSVDYGGIRSGGPPEPAERGGPIRAGRYVRLDYRDGRILRIACWD